MTISPEWIIALCGASSLIAMFIGHIIGSSVGSKIAIARLEEWRMAFERLDNERRDAFALRANEWRGDVRAIEQDLNRTREDVGVHEIEIGTLMTVGGLPRASRQLLRR